MLHGVNGGLKHGLWNGCRSLIDWWPSHRPCFKSENDALVKQRQAAAQEKCILFEWRAHCLPACKPVSSIELGNSITILPPMQPRQQRLITRHNELWQLVMTVFLHPFADFLPLPACLGFTPAVLLTGGRPNLSFHSIWFVLLLITILTFNWTFVENTRKISI